MEEVWRDIPDFEGYYQVSNLGRVRSLDRVVKTKDGLLRNIKGVILKYGFNDKGYKLVNFTKDSKGKTYPVHKLVAICFLGHKPNGMIELIDHIDEDKTNNRVDNLQIVNNRFNKNKSLSIKYKYIGVRKIKNCITYSYRIRNDKIREYKGGFKTKEAAAEAYQKRLNEIEKATSL